MSEAVVSSRSGADDLNEVIITHQLEERAAPAPNHAVENAALHAIAREFALHGDAALQALVRTAMSLCKAGSAGVSLLEAAEDGRMVFRWVAMAGAYAKFVGMTTEMNSPCGTCLERGAPQLYSWPERFFPGLAGVSPPLVEGLVIPFKAGGVRGTIWIAAHDEQRKFTKEDARLLSSLGDFTAAALLSQQERATTERTNAALRESEEFVRRILENSPDCVKILDSDARVRYINNRGVELLELPDAEACMGESWVDMWRGPDRHKAIAALATARAGGVGRFHGFRVTTLGNGKWWDVVINQLPTTEGQPARLMSVSRDITEQQTASQQIVRRSERAAMLADLAGELLAASEPQQILTRLFSKLSVWLQLDTYFHYIAREDSGTLELEGYEGIEVPTAEQIQTLKIGEAICGEVAATRSRIYLPDAADCLDPRAHSLKPMGIRCFTAEPLIVGQRLVGVLSFGSRQRDRFDEDDLDLLRTVAHLTAVARERLRIERENNEALEREQAARASAEEAHEIAASANRTKDQFLAALSHELRTPLSPVVMALASLQTDATMPAAAAQDILGMIRRNVSLEVRLIDDLLDLSRVMNGKLRLHRETVRVHKLMRQAAEICASDFNRKRVKVEFDLAAKNDTAYADPARLQQAFWNVLKNAVKFSDMNSVVTLTTRDAGESRIEVRIKDLGIGIPPEMLPRVFDAFEQGAVGQARRFGGLGLGLAISKAVVDLHGGTIRAKSAGAGKGAVFVIELLTVEPIAPIAPAETLTNSGSAELRVLVVEDHEDTARVLARLLKLKGFRVTTTGTVASALKLAGEQKFDVMVSDIGLPDSTGYELMRKVRELGLNGIAMTGYGMDEDIRQSREAGFSEHVTKPVDIAQLEQALRRVAALPLRGEGRESR